jgi:hypothetical protein
MLAALLPSAMLMWPAMYGQPMEMGEHCDMASMAGHAHAPASGNSTPDTYHECHCLLCVVHAVDVGLPPSVVQWQFSGRVDVILAQPIYTPYASNVWLIPKPRGPPALS